MLMFQIIIMITMTGIPSRSWSLSGMPALCKSSRGGSVPKVDCSTSKLWKYRSLYGVLIPLRYHSRCPLVYEFYGGDSGELFGSHKHY